MDDMEVLRGILYSIRNRKACSKIEVVLSLYEYAELHNMDINSDELIMPEVNVLFELAGMTDSSRNRIRFCDIIQINENEGFLWIFMRTGHFHALSSTSSLRFYCHILNNEKIPGIDF